MLPPTVYCKEPAGFAAKKHGAAFLDTVLVLLERRPNASAACPVCSLFIVKGELYNPKNPEYAAICDTESTKGAFDSMLVKLPAMSIPVSIEEMSGACCQRLPEETKEELIMYGFARLETRKPHIDAYQAVYDEALMIEGALEPPARSHRAAPRRRGRRRGLADSVSMHSAAARDAATAARGDAISEEMGPR